VSQIDVYEFLKQQRLSGNHRFWRPKEVEFALKDRGCSSGSVEGVRGDLLRLEWSGYLEVEMGGGIREWLRCFRLKRKYIN